MSARAAALIVPLALLAGCATAPRTTYHYDGRGDYYTGATPGTDVVIASPWHAGWGLGGWGPAGYGYGGGYFGSGYYGSPWTGWYGGGFGYGGMVAMAEPTERAPQPKGTYSWFGIDGTWFWVDPSNNLTFVAMIQRRGNAGPGAVDLRGESAQLVYKALVK